MSHPWKLSSVLMEPNTVVVNIKGLKHNSKSKQKSLGADQFHDLLVFSLIFRLHAAGKNIF